jgi:hypothetical protein
VRSLAYTVGLPKRHPLPPKLKKQGREKRVEREGKVGCQRSFYPRMNPEEGYYRSW